MGKTERKEREEETREGGPGLVPSNKSLLPVPALSQSLCHRARDVARVYRADNLRTQERAGLEGIEAT